MGGGSHGTKEDGDANDRLVVRERRVVIRARKEARLKTRTGPTKVASRAPKFGHRTQTATNHFVAVNMVSNLPFVVNVHKRKDKDIGIAG